MQKKKNSSRIPFSILSHATRAKLIALASPQLLYTLLARTAGVYDDGTPATQLRHAKGIFGRALTKQGMHVRGIPARVTQYAGHASALQYMHQHTVMLVTFDFHAECAPSARGNLFVATASRRTGISFLPTIAPQPAGNRVR